MTIPTFPSLPGLEWPVVRTRMGKTMVQEAISGKETRIQVWAYPKYKWSLSFSALRSSAAFEELQTLFGFINSLAGSVSPFYYQDTDDNAATAQSLGTGDGSTTVFQLVRAFGGFVEPVQSPAAIASVTLAGTPTSSYTLGNAGLITFASAPSPGAAIAWTGTFNWLCRLLNDNQAFSQDMATFYSAKGLEFQSIKL